MYMYNVHCTCMYMHNVHCTCMYMHNVHCTCTCTMYIVLKVYSTAVVVVCTKVSVVSVIRTVCCNADMDSVYNTHKTMLTCW